jgi:subtilisin-like proprotein convertase family protein
MNHQTESAAKAGQSRGTDIRPVQRALGAFLFKVWGVVVFGMSLGLSCASAGLYSSGALNTAIPDGNPAGITSAINVSGAGTILSSGDNVSVTLNLSGGNIGDLYAFLTFGGHTVELMNQPGGGAYLGGSFTGVTLSDGNPTSVSSYGGGNASSVSFNPSAGGTAFQAFNGMSADGTWTLFFADLSGGDGGNVTTLTSWNLNITEVPEPVTLALGIFGVLAAVVGVARHFRANGTYCPFRATSRLGAEC